MIQETKKIAKAAEIIKSWFQNEFTGHDWFHMERVLKNAMQIAKKEGGDKEIIALSALLHDVNDYKLNANNKDGADKLQQIFIDLKLTKEEKEKIIKIIQEVSFSGGYGKKPESIEAKIVQDADRLDAMGAIGIARAFAYGGHNNRLIYHPEILPKAYSSKKAYQSSKPPTLNHFYEKLLKLKSLMNTETGRKMAEKRHDFLLKFLDEFFENTGLNKSNYKVV